MQMNEFERNIVHCLNVFFENNTVSGFSYRLKQAKFNSQYVDVLVDSLDPRYYLAIECKSIKGKKLYFTQHFHEDKNQVHQIDSISNFLRKTGRRGFLAVEFRGGLGKANEAYLLSWSEVEGYYRDTTGISRDDFKKGIQLVRSSGKYILERMYPKEFVQL